MKVGTLCYPTQQGIGLIAKGLYDHGIIHRPFVVGHASHPNHYEWYPERPRAGIRELKNRDVDAALKSHCASVDVMLFIETPFVWSLIPYCRSIGVRTALMTMYECTPSTLPFQPDKFLCPSLLDMEYYPERSKFLPIPVEVPWRQRTKAEVFVHNAGHGGLRGRNGTKELIEALRLVKSPIKFLLRSQEGAINDRKLLIPDHIDFTWKEGTVAYDMLFKDGDVFVFPDKFCGQSCPMEEARAAGMLVMGSDRFPNNSYLPVEPLIPVKRTTPAQIGSCNKFLEAVIEPKDIAAKIDEWYGRDITDYSAEGRDWANSRSWEVLKPQYLEALKS